MTTRTLPKLLTIREACAALRVSRATLYRTYLDTGALPSIRLSNGARRIAETDLSRLEQTRVETRLGRRR